MNVIYVNVAGKSHALHKRVEQLCTRAIKWGELKRKSKVLGDLCNVIVTLCIYCM